MNNMIKVFDYENWKDYELRWNTPVDTEKVNRFQKYRNKRVVLNGMNTYGILGIKESVTITARFIKEVHQPDSDGFNIERAMEFLDHMGDIREMMLEFFGVKDYNSDRDELLFNAFENNIDALIADNSEELFVWVKNYVEIDIDTWKQFLSEEGYEVKE